MPALAEQRKRAVLARLASVLASCLLLLTASAVLMARSGTRINLSGSASIGLYRLTSGELELCLHVARGLAMLEAGFTDSRHSVTTAPLGSLI